MLAARRRCARNYRSAKSYAITRRAGFEGGVALARCGSTYRGRRRPRAPRRRARLRAAASPIFAKPTRNSPGGFTDFLDEIIVDAQGVGSPYRLKGDPISSTIQVGVIAKDGNLYILKRSSVSGFDYNPSSRAIAFFTRGTTYTGTNVSRVFSATTSTTSSNWVKVLISYRVWERQTCAPASARSAMSAACAHMLGGHAGMLHAKQPMFECRPTFELHLRRVRNLRRRDQHTCRPDPTPCASGCGLPAQHGCDARTTSTCINCAPGAAPAAIPCSGEGCTARSKRLRLASGH